MLAPKSILRKMICPLVLPRPAPCFFASAGHNSMGGRDLFYANPAGDGFGDVVNLNSPFTSVPMESSIIVRCSR